MNREQNVILMHTVASMISKGTLSTHIFMINLPVQKERSGLLFSAPINHGCFFTIRPVNKTVKVAYEPRSKLRYFSHLISIKPIDPRIAKGSIIKQVEVFL